MRRNAALSLQFRIPLLKVRLVFSFWFFALVALFALLDHRLMVRYVALPVLIHEGGHLLALALCRIPVKEIVFTPVSVDIRRWDDVSAGWVRQLIVALAGIVANLTAAALLHRFRFQSLRTMLMIASHLAVALFNLLPIGTLDGGQALGILCGRFFSYTAARVVSRTASLLALTVLFAFAIFLLLRGAGNLTLFACCTYLALTVIARD